jgi:hypothetical protein
MTTDWALSGIGNRPRVHKPGDPDFFIEPSWVVDLLLDAEQFICHVHDPACGIGTIVQACRKRGILATGTDIVDRGFGYCCGPEFDFLDIPVGNWFENIICNPPYGLAEPFVRHALALTRRKAAFLLQAKFPYSQKRHELFKQHPPARVYFLSTRPSIPPGDLFLAQQIERGGGKLDYCWMVWSRDHVGPTTCHWLIRPVQ